MRLSLCLYKYLLVKLTIVNCRYETDDGINFLQERLGNSVTGGYSYTAPTGESIEVTYIADENGYRPIVLLLHPQGVAPPPAYRPSHAYAAPVSFDVICSLVGCK